MAKIMILIHHLVPHLFSVVALSELELKRAWQYPYDARFGYRPLAAG